MNKHLMIVGIAILLVCVGLGGCEQLGVSSISLSEIKAHPNQYLGKTITVEGY